LKEGCTVIKVGTGNQKFTRYYRTVLENQKMKWKDNIKDDLKKIGCNVLKLN
jgi:hypothetical protein